MSPIDRLCAKTAQAQQAAVWMRRELTRPGGKHEDPGLRQIRAWRSGGHLPDVPRLSEMRSALPPAPRRSLETDSTVITIDL